LELQTENRKPFKIIDEQIYILRNRGMVVDEPDRLLLMREGASQP
jgi:hypothetical protein